MNNNRRSKLKKAIQNIDVAIDITRSSSEEEDIYLNSIPENFSEKISLSEDAVEYMGEAIELLEDAISKIELAMS